MPTSVVPKLGPGQPLCPVMWLVGAEAMQVGFYTPVNYLCLPISLWAEGGAEI